MLVLPAIHPAMGQDPGPDSLARPEEKWEVKKEYDEHGNLIYYDSSYSRTWKHFDFPELGDWQKLEDLDSMFGDFFFQMPQGFDHFRNFPDSAWTDRFFPDSMFQDAFVPFEDFFPPSFHGPNGFFDKHQKILEKFRQEFFPPDDTLHRLHPKWQQLPGQQKNRPRGIEI